MSPHFIAETVAEIYDQALKYARDQNLPTEAPRPHPTCDWPTENLALLERYREWLSSGGTSAFTTRLIYLAAAGHVLGFNLKPHAQIDLETDFRPAEAYIRAKGQSRVWTRNNLNGLEKFKRFLRHERGMLEYKVTPYDVAAHTQGLPEWLVTELERFQHLRQPSWRPARLDESIARFWSGYLRIWRYLVEQCGVQDLKDLKRSHLYAYIEQRAKLGRAVSGINADLRELHSFLVFLQDQGYAIPQTLLRVPTLKRPDALPRYLTDEQVRLLRDEFERRVAQARNQAELRDALLDRAIFYLLWQSALRKGEVEDLLLEDLDLTGRKLIVRQGKGMKDRTVFLTDTTVQALNSYLVVRGMGPTGHVFLYRNQPLSKCLIHGRITAVGEKVGVKVHSHRLRHTCATQLLNAGCRITSIQKFLGHKKLNSTLAYARVHDQTVADDYYLAMSSVENRLQLLPQEEDSAPSIPEPERVRLLTLADRLSEPELSHETRLDLVAQLRLLLSGKEMEVVPLVDLPPPNAPVPIQAPMWS